MIKVLNINLYDSNIPSSVELILSQINSTTKANLCISATGAHGMVYASKNSVFKNILNNFYLNLPDGMPGVWIGRFKGAKKMKRCYGPDFFKELLKASASKLVKHFFCGGKEGVADDLKKECELKFNNYNIVGTFCPPFREMTDEEFIQLGNQINQSNADIVWIGLSTPKQEQFAWKLKQYVNTHFIITVGAAFDIHSNKVKHTPSWIQKIGMEWFFRLLNNPRRLFKRYLEIVPLFIYYNFREVVSFYISKYLKAITKKN